MKILISGSTGFIGSALVAGLKQAGHEIIRLVRKNQALDEPQVLWDPTGKGLDPETVPPIDAVIHLAGEGIASGRWTKSKKQRIRDSRIKATRLLCDALLQQLPQPPKMIACASATGFYGDRGDEVLSEASNPGTGFLPEVCQEWESALQPAAKQGIRVAHLRFGMVLGNQGGALKAMLTPFRFGLGGVIGSGNQYWSWIALSDVTAAIMHVLNDEQLQGAVNIVAPEPTTNREFTKILGRVLHRPTFCPVPGFAARLMLGEMADGLLLASARVKPVKLEESGFEYQYPELETALRMML